MADLQGLKKYVDLFFPAPLRDLLNIVKEAIRGGDETVIRIVTKNDFNRLAALSDRHKTEYSLFHYFQQHPSPALAEELKELREKITQQAVKSLRQLNELISLCRLFNKKGLRYAVIKGPHLARMLYGKEAVKVSVDLDIMLVNPVDLEAFHKSFPEAGYGCTQQHLMTGNWKQRLFVSAKREVHYFSRKAGCAVDLHVKPLANSILTAHRYRDFFADIVQEDFEGVTIPVLPVEKYFVYLCYHAACHRFSRLAWLLDIVQFYRLKKDGMEADKVLALARSLNMERPVWLAFAMMNLLFEVAIPEKIDACLQRYNSLEWMVKSCLKAIAYEKGEDLKFRARLSRMIYLIRLSRGFAGKMDVVLSIILRNIVLILFQPGGRPPLPLPMHRGKTQRSV